MLNKKLVFTKILKTSLLLRSGSPFLQVGILSYKNPANLFMVVGVGEKPPATFQIHFCLSPILQINQIIVIAFLFGSKTFTVNCLLAQTNHVCLMQFFRGQGEMFSSVPPTKQPLINFSSFITIANFLYGQKSTNNNFLETKRFGPIRNYFKQQHNQHQILSIKSCQKLSFDRKLQIRLKLQLLQQQLYIRKLQTKIQGTSAERISQTINLTSLSPFQISLSQNIYLSLLVLKKQAANLSYQNMADDQIPNLCTHYKTTYNLYIKYKIYVGTCKIHTTRA
eukprot:TRINITY_DN11702_c0_g1_i1.p1 TRINITY_DN11702_c0_g1~~TRINITY_DN11702_c0_g1_i1.p1  ORF type:complete len:280 (+),score=-12.01 TRINITY_DN11702_c0_g1_i1:753-1592(+)